MKPSSNFHKLSSILLLIASLLISITLGALKLNDITNTHVKDIEPKNNKT